MERKVFIKEINAELYGHQILAVALKARIIDVLDELKTRWDPQRTTGAGITGFSNLDQLRATGEAAAKWIREEEAGLIKIPELMAFIDGDRTGLMSSLFSQTTTKVTDEYLTLWESTVTPLLEKINNRSREDSSRMERKVFIEEINAELYGHQILAVALNAGNQSNLVKMLEGEGWGSEEQGNLNVNNPRLQAILRHLTQSDVEIIEAVWEALNSLYPLLEKTSIQQSNKAPPRVESQSFEVVLVDGTTATLNGGYYPMVYDPKRSTIAAEFADKRSVELQSPFASAGSIRQSVTAGSVNERTAFSDPVLLDTKVLQSHFEEVITYITHYDTVKQLSKIIKDREIRKKMKEKLGENVPTLLDNWLNDVAKQNRSSEMRVFGGRAVNHLRNCLLYTSPSPRDS